MTDWNADVQAAGSGADTVKYLSLYVFKVGISDHRVESFENGRVTFRYRKTGSNRDRRTTAGAEEFIRRYPRHVLPSGFMKIGRYGIANPNSSVSMETVKGLIELSLGFEIDDFEPESVSAERAPRCPNCGGKLEYPHSVPPYMTGKGAG